MFCQPWSCKRVDVSDDDSVDEWCCRLRFLRNKDRDLNADCYPKLRHPEVYLLGGGYREFHEHYGALCTPVGGYVPMVDQNFADELIFYRQASKLYNGSVVERKKSSSTTRSRYCRIWGDNQSDESQWKCSEIWSYRLCYSSCTLLMCCELIDGQGFERTWN